ncbi:protein-disulfide reductase DsbD domain-containing protein [Rhodoplanes sp. Z2-YC6860]|uniref:protein-disulfide reductase DsbD domain-containing protein n=1 Tax=Rhodoplanes sp. Z2-YC6860 TaxID=674703 RepID=UPI001F3DEE0F|nr:protein-disulfide reductase DsbD domain-containing protein [Rhodoplanes sp. Z2-YC6860]
MQSAVRLIAARGSGSGNTAVYRSAVEIKLNPGWKTYWRYPGDSGVPPAFDFSKSENVKSASVLFPAPSLFEDGAGGHSIGYKKAVLLPVHVVPKDPKKPAVLRAKIDYAVCEKLCVPADANLELTLPGTDSANDTVVDTAEALLPKMSSVGDGGTLAIRAAHKEAGKGKPKIVVDVAAPAGAAPVLYAEGPDAKWALPVPEPMAGAPAGLQRFTFELDGLPPGENGAGATLRLTAVAGDKAVEALFRLD